MVLPFTGLSTSPPSEAEQTLKSWAVEYEKKSDGTLFVPGNINISRRGLTKLPDLSSVTINGNFWCADNQLTSLKGAPASVGGSFDCYNNQLTSLEHAPASVGGGFDCHNNQLTSLDGAPATVGYDFFSSGNQLTSLEGAPKEFKTLKTDLGEFSNREQIPEHLRTSPETRARIERERLAEEASRKASLETAIANAVVLQNNIPIKGPLKLKSRG